MNVMPNPVNSYAGVVTSQVKKTPARLEVEIQYKRLGDVIKALREKRKLSRAELTAQLNWSEGYLPLVERGERRLTLPQINAVARILGVEPWKLLKSIWE